MFIFTFSLSVHCHRLKRNKSQHKYVVFAPSSDQFAIGNPAARLCSSRWLFSVDRIYELFQERPRMQDWMGDWMDRMEFLEPWGRIYAGPGVRSTHPVLHSRPTGTFHDKSCVGTTALALARLETRARRGAPPGRRLSPPKRPRPTKAPIGDRRVSPKSISDN